MIHDAGWPDPSLNSPTFTRQNFHYARSFSTPWASGTDHVFDKKSLLAMTEDPLFTLIGPRFWSECGRGAWWALSGAKYIPSVILEGSCIL